MSELYIENLSPVIDKELATELGQFTGDWITLNKDVKIDNEALTILSNYKGRIFSDSDKCEWEDFELQNKVRSNGSSSKISEQLKSLGIKGVVLQFYGHYEWHFHGHSLYEVQEQKIDIEPIINNIIAFTFPGPDKLSASQHAESYVVIIINTEREYGMLYHNHGYEFQCSGTCYLHYLLILSIMEDIKVANLNLVLKQLDVSKGFEVDDFNDGNTTSPNNRLSMSFVQDFLNYSILSPSAIAEPFEDWDYDPDYSDESLRIKNITRYESTNLSICLESKSFIFSNSKGSVTVSINEPLNETAKIFL
ncbi:MAG: hypothetical protein H8E12_18505 [Rhodobacteraceae bacterium]|nr:hypothetical protein [Paracoccaceae bacterium]